MWAGSRIIFRSQEYRDELATFNHPIARAPVWAIRALGMFVTAGGLWAFYEFLITYMSH